MQFFHSQCNHSCLQTGLSYFGLASNKSVEQGYLVFHCLVVVFVLVFAASHLCYEVTALNGYILVHMASVIKISLGKRSRLDGGIGLLTIMTVLPYLPTRHIKSRPSFRGSSLDDTHRQAY